MENKKNQIEKTTSKQHKSRQLTPELSTQSSTLSKNPKINLSVYGHTITKSKNKKIIITKKKLII